MSEENTYDYLNDEIKHITTFDGKTYRYERIIRDTEEKRKKISTGYKKAGCDVRFTKWSENKQYVLVYVSAQYDKPVAHW